MCAKSLALALYDELEIPDVHRHDQPKLERPAESLSDYYANAETSDDMIIACDEETIVNIMPNVSQKSIFIVHKQEHEQVSVVKSLEA